MKAIVIVPTYNERENVEWLASEIMGLRSDLDLLFVDDSSPDGTGEVVERLTQAESRISVLHRERKLGLGSAYVAGFRFALERGYEYIFEMDADHSHDPRSLPDFLTSIQTYDVVLGSRYLDGISIIHWGLGRLLLSYLANAYAQAVTGLKLTDLTTGYRCYRRSVLEAMDLSRIFSRGYAFQIELASRAHQMGFKVGEIPIVFYGRHSGVSKMSRRTILEAALIVWRLRFFRDGAKGGSSSIGLM